MNTPTPRTDRLAELDITTDGTWIAHARQLERELATERETSRLLKVAMDARDEGYTQSRRRMSALERELAAGGAWLNHVLPIDCAFDDRAAIDNDIKEMTRESKK